MNKRPEIDLRPYFVTLDDLDEPVVWEKYFGNSQPVELDVGCGRGLFVFRASKENPDTNYVGLEIDYKKGRRGALRLQKREIANGRIWGGDANRVFDKLLLPQSVSAVHVYFPDPWWKRRHRKRRIFTENFLDRVARTLKPEGMLHFWTDVKEYWEIAETLVQNDSRFEAQKALEERTPEHDMDYQTSFERKKRKIGCTIYRGRWKLAPKR